MTYAEKLKDPRWQKKRLEILQRDGFKCRSCGNEEETLHVHHMIADFKISPWEHKDHTMVTLCEECHRTYHHIYQEGYYYDIIECVVEFTTYWEVKIDGESHG